MSTFSHKHYQAIGKVLVDARLPDEQLQTLVDKFGYFFSGDNPRFDFKKWQSYVTRLVEGTYRKMS